MRYFIIIFSFFCFIFASCQRTPTIKNNNDDGESAAKITPSQDSTFDFASIKAKVDFQSPKESSDFKLGLRIQNNKKIWISATGPLGIEGLRATLREDSIFIINRIEKKYTESSFDTLSRLLNFEVDYSMLQGIFLAEMPLKDFDTTRKNVVDNQILIKQKLKYINIDNYLNPIHKKLEKLFLLDTRTGHRLEINYQNYKAYNKIWFPEEATILVSYIDKNTRKPAKTTINIRYQNVIFTHDKLAFPFSVPNSYRQKK
ncbi:MAG: DUF4292 domain-containing protein [Bacteroidetes bacterium]|nr:MAG: DUF4292 domain-containing protein [Bacteroidota bacterium]TAG86990.1 MAG: DUF4292 domain-containing protein [Bacteroidota bacterium]